MKFNASTAAPVCGAALSLASFGAACKAEAPQPTDSAVSPPAKATSTVVAKVPELAQEKFLRFTDIDFRHIMSLPPSERVARVDVSTKQELASSTAQAPSPASPKPTLPSSDGAGMLAAASLFGIGGAKKLAREKESTSTGGPTPGPKRTSEPSLKPWASASKQEEQKQQGSFRKIVSTLWNLWERPTNLFPAPWNTVVKWGVPAVAATCGMVWFQTVLQVGVVAAQMFGSILEPLAGAAAFIVPMVAADPIMRGIEKMFKLEPITGLKRQAILKPIQGGLLVGAAAWIQSVTLSPITYGLWAVGGIGVGYLASKVFQRAKAATWAAVGTALALPWAHMTTQRTFDVKVLNAGPDPEVGAWNVTTDLSKLDHWKSVAFFGKQAPSSGKQGMVFLNRDIPLYIPPHREANEFNGHFANLIGKDVRITTIGAWLKPLSPKLQPTIVKYEVLASSSGTSTTTNAPAAITNSPSGK